MDRLVKCAYLTLTENGFPTFTGVIRFVVWELKNYKGISIQIGILGFWYWITMWEHWYGISTLVSKYWIVMWVS